MPNSLSLLATEHPEALFDALNRVHSVIAFSLNGEVLDANSNFLAMFGYTLPEVVGQHHSLFCDPEYVRSPDYAELWQRLARGEVDSGEYRRVAKNGADVWIQSSYNPIFDAYGKPKRVMKFATDITQRKQAELALRRTQLALEMSNQAARIGTWEYEPALQRFHTSAVVRQLLRLPEHPCLGLQALSDRLVNPAHLHQAIALAVSHGMQLDLEMQVRHHSGGVSWVRAIGRCETLEGSGKRLYGTFQDIDASKTRERELAQAREVAEAASHSKDMFLASMSHELRTPLNAILGFGQMLECDDGLSADQQDNVQEILKAGKHLLSLINDVLDLAKISAGRVEIRLSAVALEGVIEACEALIQPMAQVHGIRLCLSHCTGLAVWADAVRLKQVLLNLLTNAVKYNRPGGDVRLECEQTPKGMLRLSVTDTGMGIQNEDLKRVFKPFTRVSGTDSQVEGTGIGLSITQQLVEAMGGRIGLQSQLGVGSCFWVDFPLRQSDEVAHAASPMATPQAAHEVNTMFQVLCIDDNPANLKLVSRVLQDTPNLVLHTAQDAAKGLEVAQALGPDLILLDINLPGSDGYSVLQRLRAVPHLAAVPVLAVTANAMPQDIARGQAAGFAHYITKPLDIPAFLAVVQQYMRRHSS